MSEPFDSKYKLFKENDCPNANYIMENGLYLPSGNTITDEEIDFVCNEIKTISYLLFLSLHQGPD